jgi:hypothetical protein
MSNTIAPKGQVYVCCACGKRSKDRYGDQPIDHDWDVSCMMNSVLVYEDSIQLGESGRVIKADPVIESHVEDPEKPESVQENIERFKPQTFRMHDVGPRGESKEAIVAAEHSIMSAFMWRNYANCKNRN